MEKPLPSISHEQAGQFALTLLRAPERRGMDVFFSGLLDGLDTELQQSGSVLDLLIVTSLDEEIEALRRWAKAGDVDAVAIADIREGDPRPRLCQELGLPAVLIGVNDAADCGGVSVDNAGAMRLGLEYLRALGHKTIGRVSGPSNLTHTKVRDQTFEEILSENDCSGVIMEGDYTAGAGYEVTTVLLDSEHRPTAIIYDNDVMAVAGLEAAAEMGLSVPADLSILAWDDSAVSRLADPPLSVISRDVRKLGALTAKALLMVQAGEIPRLSLLSDAQVVARSTTDVAKISAV